MRRILKELIWTARGMALELCCAVSRLLYEPSQDFCLALMSVIMLSYDMIWMQ